MRYNFTDVLDGMYCMFDFLHEFGLEIFCTVGYFGMTKMKCG